MSVETSDYAAMLVRMVRALGPRLATGDPIELREVARVQAELDRALRVGVEGLRAAGFSGAEIGRELGISRQAVHDRFGPLASAG